MSDDTTTLFGKRFASTLPASGMEGDDEEALQAFGFLRGSRERAVFLEFRFKDGRSLAFNYSYLDRVQYDPSEGIRLRFPSAEVMIKGQGLNDSDVRSHRLLEMILRQRVTWIQEMSRADVLEAVSGVVVESIEVE